VSTEQPGRGELEGLTSDRSEGLPSRLEGLLLFLAGVGFGIALMRSEVASWYRIFEMFRFDSFHLFGVIGSAVATAALGMALLRRFGVRSLTGGSIAIDRKARTPWLARYLLGGTLFGVGWALVGACPGPIFAWLGAGASIYLVPLASALLGTWAYGAVRDRLPH
jgi:uncharacterized membrane protein YedE/YeeE